MATLETLPQYFLERTRQQPDDPAIGWIEDGVVKGWTFAEYRSVVERASLALRAFGLEPDEKVAIISATRKEWHVLDIAIQCAWGVVVPIYPSYLSDEVVFLVDHSESVFVIAEDEAQLDKVVASLRRLPRVRILLTLAPISAQKRSQIEAGGGPTLLTFEQLLKEGGTLQADHPSAFEQAVEAQLPEDLATIVYTSGTTGIPKGAMITQGAIAANFRNVLAGIGDTFSRSDTVLTFLPLSHIFGRQDSFLILVYGWRMIFADSIEKIVENIALVRPTIMAAVPRVFEKIYARILQQVDEGSVIKRRVFRWALHVSSAFNAKVARGETPGRYEQTMQRLAWKLVFSKIYKRFGGRMRYFISGGASLSPEIMLFLRHANLIILEGYGLTESISGCVVNPASHQIPGTVGRPLGDTEIKIAEDGEILIRSASCFCGYYKDPEETAATLIDGWLQTGDIGGWTPEGYLQITDRKKDLIKTSGGKYIIPQKIEGLMKTSRYISHCVVIGEGHNYATALIGLERERFKNLLGILGLKPDATVADIAQAKKTRYFIENDVAEANKHLARFETIKKFYIVPEEITVESGLMTASLKVKRKIIIERYKEAIDFLYAGS